MMQLMPNILPKMGVTGLYHFFFYTHLEQVDQIK
jgi:hypothetical protein